VGSPPPPPKQGPQGRKRERRGFWRVSVVFYFFLWDWGGRAVVFFAVLRCFLFNVFAVCMWGRGGGRGGRDSQPSLAQPNSWRGAATHEYRVTPTIYIYAVYKETGQEKECRTQRPGRDGRWHSFTFSFIFPQGLIKHLLCNRCWYIRRLWGKGH
jgi:hypothetical protein